MRSRVISLTRRAALLSLTAAAACAHRPTGALDAILARNLEALGGRTAVDSITTVWRRRRERLFTLSAPPHQHMVLLLKDDADEVLYAEGMDHGVAWEEQADGRGRRQVTGRPAEALANTMQRPWNLMPLIDARGRGHDVAHIGVEEIEGRLFEIVRVTLASGQATDYFISRESWLVERARDVRRLHAYEAEAQPIETVWSDFRSVGGVVFPFSELERNVETGERLSGGRTMLDLKVNVAVSPGTFSLAGGYADLLAPAGLALSG